MSLTFEKLKSLQTLNTFGFDRCAELFAEVRCEQEIEEAVRYAADQKLPLFVLGGGSNLVIVDDIPGLVIQLTDLSISHVKQDSLTHLITASAGVNWHALVTHTLAMDIAGLENLSLIPGSVGASPVQNIGAYGVEVKDRIKRVRAFHLPSRRWVNLSAQDCKFGYRHSMFKDHLDEYIISEVEFILGARHPLQSTYNTLDQHLQARGLLQPTALQISESVIQIRRSRLPDPAAVGNAGSFFHNPVVAAEHRARLLQQYPQLPAYLQADGTYKLAAAWLIDNLGFKGMVKEGVGVHDAQALVLINTGSGTGREIMNLAKEIKDAVLENYGIPLNIEPRVMQVNPNTEVIRQ
ncbi:MAG: UDP-N-acetylmuramate dehydrogenase [Granulosicoccus sp.]